MKKTYLHPGLSSSVPRGFCCPNRSSQCIEVGNRILCKTFSKKRCIITKNSPQDRADVDDVKHH